MENEIKNATLEIEKVEEKKKPRKRKKETQDHLYIDGMYDSEEFKKTHLFKCKVRASKTFGVTIDHLESAYINLNGKKIDGFYITQIIDRFGFSNGKMLSRSQIANQNGQDSVKVVEVAEEKITDILKNKNVVQAYQKHIKDFADGFLYETKTKTIFGE